MSRALIGRRAGPGLTLQDCGRPGYMGFGLSRGGAADRQALAEGAALLGQDDGLAVLEMAGMGGNFVEIAGNDDIMLTALADRRGVPGTIFSLPRQGYRDWRHVMMVEVDVLGEVLRTMTLDTLRVEHVHDY